MDQEKLGYFTKRLQDEKKLVEVELKSLGVHDPVVPEVWDATPGQIDTSATESDEVADRFEQQETNEDQLKEIEPHWRNIKRALDKIEQGNFGICEIGGEVIEYDRLDANPSARTCKLHIEEESTLSA